MQKKRIVLTILITLVLNFTIYPIYRNVTDLENEKKNLDFLKPFSAEIHSKIYIDGNSALDAFCSGDGTDGLSWASAHVIEDYEIDAEFSGSGIEIRYTDAYLIIDNCTVVNSGTIEGDAGISIWSCSNIKVMNCIIDYCENAIFLADNSLNNIVINNTIRYTSGFAAISIGGHHNQILNNTLTDNDCYSINLFESEHNVIYGNILINNEGGIQVEYSHSNLFAENEISGSRGGDGFKLAFSNENTISKNILSEGSGGITLWDSENNIITDNGIYLYPETGDNGIYFYNSLDNLLENNTISDAGSHGIFLEDSPNNAIQSNTVSNSIYDSIKAIRSDNVLISDNSVSISDFGICLMNSNYVEISRNTIFQNNFGIYLISSHDNNISGNNLIDNGVGIYIDEVSKCNEISTNLFSGNGEDIQNFQGDCLSENLLPLIIGIILGITSILIIAGILVVKRRSSRRNVNQEDKYIVSKEVVVVKPDEIHDKDEVEPEVEPEIEPEVEPVVEPEVEPVVEPEVEPVVEPEVEPVVEEVTIEQTKIQNTLQNLAEKYASVPLSSVIRRSGIESILTEQLVQKILSNGKIQGYFNESTKDIEFGIISKEAEKIGAVKVHWCSHFNKDVEVNPNDAFCQFCGEKLK